MNNSLKIKRSRFFRDAYESWRDAGMYRVLLKRLKIRYQAHFFGECNDFFSTQISNEHEFVFVFPANHLFGQTDFILEFLSESIGAYGMKTSSVELSSNVSDEFGFEVVERVELRRKTNPISRVLFGDDAERVVLSVAFSGDRARLGIRHISRLKSPAFRSMHHLMESLFSLSADTNQEEYKPTPKRNESPQ